LAVSYERKEEILAKYTKLVEKTEGLIVTEYRGMKMNEFHDIRKALREVGSSYLVTKNRLLKIALRNRGIAAPNDLLTGPVAITFVHRDLAGSVKALLDKKKTMEKLILKGAIVGSIVVPEADLEGLSNLPSLDQIRAQLIGLLIAPAQGLLGVLAAPAQGLVGVLDAGSNQVANVLAAYANKEDAA